MSPEIERVNDLDSYWMLRWPQCEAVNYVIHHSDTFINSDVRYDSRLEIKNMNKYAIFSEYQLLPMPKEVIAPS